jgi:hypothetical protein
MKAISPGFPLCCILLLVLAGPGTSKESYIPGSQQLPGSQQPLRPGTLCAPTEQVVFNCISKRSSRIISLCSSKDLDKDHGYIQYRFGTSSKTELEFPEQTAGSQKLFYYSHYFRARVDETEISFNNGEYNYRIFDSYQGEQKPARRSQGITVTPPGKGAATTLQCAAPAKADYSNLGDILPCDPDSSLNLDGCPKSGGL